MPHEYSIQIAKKDLYIAITKPFAMAETKVLSEISELKKMVFGMKQDINFIKDVFQDKYLSKEDKKALEETLKAEKAGRLKSMKEVFG